MGRLFRWRPRSRIARSRSGCRRWVGDLENHRQRRVGGAHQRRVQRGGRTGPIAQRDPLPMDSMGLARIIGFVAPAVALTATDAPGQAADSAPSRIVVWADRDDDDADGRPDGEQTALPPPGRVDLVPLPARLVGAVLQAVSGGDHARVLVGSSAVPLPWGRVVPEPAWLQGLTPGTVELVAKGAG